MSEYADQPIHRLTETVHPDTQALFSKDERGVRVFYDIDTLVGNYTETVVANTLRVAQDPDTTDVQKAYLLGQVDILKAMSASSLSLRGEEAFDNTTMADFLP